MAKYFRSKRKGKYKSRLESDFATLCFKHGVGFEYEATRIPYTRLSHYVPDWKIGPDVYIETKGYLAPSNRANILSFKEQYPGIRILFLFGNADNRLHSKSKTTYAQWAEKHGLEYADIRKGLPLHWWKKYANNNDNPENRKGRRRQHRSDLNAVV